MIAIECTIGPVSLSLQSDSQVHPEVVETLFRQITVQSALAFNKVMDEQAKRGVAAIEGD